MFSSTENPAVIRTDFDNQEAWGKICDLIRSPVREGEDTFYSYVDFVEDSQYRNQPVAELIRTLPKDYKHSFLFVVDRETVSGADFPILVVDLLESRGRTFRTIPAQVQGIENNVSIANMGFDEFADAVDRDGVFRSFRT